MNKTILTRTALLLALLLVPAGLSAETVLAKGAWTKRAHSVSGTWKIVEDGGKRKLVVSDLKTKSGPDLKLFLSPQTPGAVTGKTATKGALRVASLKTAKGSSEYPLPASVDLSRYRSLLLHCEKYSKLWSSASL